MLKTVVALLLLASCVSWTDAGACGQDRLLYDEETEVCCAGAIHEKETGWMCCNEHWISTDQDKCIQRRIRMPKIKSNIKNCNAPNFVYDLRFWACCDNRLITLSPTVDCCDGMIVYNPQTSICEADKHRVVKKQLK
ncbi:hypothetical protein LSAT2_026106 [Lamellibrachia satsuma]|nr:hypothetical protein LSAT2_026106 [Lamellibrachia satsuma]